MAAPGKPSECTANLLMESNHPKQRTQVESFLPEYLWGPVLWQQSTQFSEAKQSTQIKALPP